MTDSELGCGVGVTLGQSEFFKGNIEAARDSIAGYGARHDVEMNPEQYLAGNEGDVACEAAEPLVEPEELLVASLAVPVP